MISWIIHCHHFALLLSLRSRQGLVFFPLHFIFRHCATRSDYFSTKLAFFPLCFVHLGVCWSWESFKASFSTNKSTFISLWMLFSDETFFASNVPWNTIITSLIWCNAGTWETGLLAFHMKITWCKTVKRGYERRMKCEINVIASWSQVEESLGFRSSAGRKKQLENVTSDRIYSENKLVAALVRNSQNIALTLPQIGCGDSRSVCGGLDKSQYPVYTEVSQNYQPVVKQPVLMASLSKKRFVTAFCGTSRRRRNLLTLSDYVLSKSKGAEMGGRRGFERGVTHTTVT